ncbi:hypothetical protein [Pandoraea apista]|uniref:hypothetical protein n=1 Tax=Pandoraea apista TaxID=93218 RepID=UPI000658B1B9|nr:hypothetical protein [Pandoraea apista]CFB63157.1 hypothetical protein LMG16407_03232 [Pandoraea apista]
MCVAAAIVGGSVASAGIGAIASSSAADTQADAAQRAADTSYAQYQQTREDLAPYRDFGQKAIGGLDSALANPLLSASFTAPTAAEAAATPGYQFTLDQGLKAAQNSASARGLGASGAALKGAEAYATGLADSTYNDTFNRNLAAFKTNYSSASDNVNRLLAAAGLGQNAAAQTGNAGAQAANSVANSITSAGNASAAGTVGVGNAISGGINSAANGLLLNNLLSNNTSMYGSRGAFTSSQFSNPDGR